MSAELHRVRADEFDGFGSVVTGAVAPVLIGTGATALFLELLRHRYRSSTPRVCRPPHPLTMPAKKTTSLPAHLPNHAKMV